MHSILSWQVKLSGIRQSKIIIWVEQFRVIPCRFNTGMTPTLSKFLYILQAVNIVRTSLISKFEHHSCNSFWGVLASAKFTTTAFYILTCNFIPVHGISIKICTRMYLYVEISNIALSSLHLQPVGKKSNYVFLKTRNIHHFYWKIFYGSHTEMQQWFLLHIFIY
jgi:hypothetical protein